MPPTSDPRVAELLEGWSRGDDEALAQLVSLLVDDLRALARRAKRGEPADLTWSTTELMSELYLRYASSERVEWNDRAHFFAASATMIRRILVDHARYRGRQKRGPERWALPLEPNALPVDGRDASLIDLDEALTSLARVHPRPAEVVQLMYFVGLTQAETAAVLNLDPRTVRRDWQSARLWLLDYLSPDGESST
jgi:RNA polymerase sigma factor (TIGR02999 family)